MRNLLLILLVFGFALTQAQHHHEEKSGNKVTIQKAAEGQKYTCPMHPEVVSDKPGKCPKCGMELVPMKEQKPAQEDSDLKRNPKNGLVSFEGKVVRYDLYVSDSMVNYTGKHAHAYAINGQLPAPTLYFTEGDTAEIHVHNNLKKENTALHWHGVMLENKEDGIPFLTQKPIKPGETYVYRFKISQNGTYWYHSHQGLQEQMGMYGMLVFRKRGEAETDRKVQADIPVMLSEWTNEHPHQVMRRLQMGVADWYAIKKKSVQSYSEAIASGNFFTKLKNEWKRMEAMDISDVYYDKFLLNGQPSTEYKKLKAGDKVRLRVANGGASSYFWLTYAGGKITVVGNDGNDVEPVEVDRLIIGISETYDIEVTIPENKSFEFRSTSEDRTGYASLWLGDGEKVEAPGLKRLMLFEGMKSMNNMMKMNGDMKPMNMKMGLQQMDANSVMYPEVPEEDRKATMKHLKEMMNPVKKSKPEKQEHANHDMPLQLSDSKAEEQTGHNMTDKKENHGGDDTPLQLSDSKADEHAGHNMADMTKEKPVTLNYNMLRSTEMTILPADAPVKELKFTLEGNMRRYVWSLDNKTVTETDKIKIKRGEVVRITLYNNSMMRHPMHLHGHDFRVINSQGEYSPLKNVLDLMPMETVTIEFPANQDGDWFFHCHILYHMMAGMGRIFSYEDSKPNPYLTNPKKDWKDFLKDNHMWAHTATVAIESRSTHAALRVGDARYELQGELHTGYTKSNGYEAELKFGRYIGKFQWLYPYIGFQSRSRTDDPGENRKTMFGQFAEHDKRHVFAAGFQYILPWLVTADTSIDQNGKVRLQLQREDIPISPRIRGSFMVNTDKEYRMGLSYILQKWLQVSSHYDSDMGWSAGLTLVY
ncbi:multicopper oxidase domain-containing protein [Elizabethkingia meningoseptica]|uniref:multicopper oxidase domain-containing protein n=1 Tax=Elizabethkingia meningoseptica TaxID=238 RepID=UPI0023B1B8C9|nr:multicopper oxidase domain-containing protein [Elizabethkingia meningoseptica]MDE5438808.1 multicopper oxidase domain-containing protein [Elizabethkingia meningoseptica]MDE5507943.1 multicopper oxidase domain-containing protein [Elizabethkingia meningoseptica]MDE5516189.1 multicopper oxidase domain-containing protein [Elizabethkingia meningoseptica]MDE5530499.1 multicopper oxidase domain-containing protein [Elizabethkingia meningoseptica]MDE5534056.1 multicopper oxidase domain-containing pr